MRTLSLIALASLAIGNGCALQPLRPTGPPTPQAAYTQLLSIDYFAFGGVGYAGTTSDGETAFRMVASTTNAFQLFSAALTNGNAQAKLYALCAIRQLSLKDFDTHAKSVVTISPKVETMRGCMIGHEWTSNVVAQITSGSYDSYIKIAKR
jgi:hypothetical protein